MLECVYIVVGRELGEEHTPHLQGYIHFKDAISFRQCKRLLGDRAHIEKSQGTAAENRTYCTKDGDYFECGIMPEQGKRRDIDLVRELVKDGKPMRDIADEVRYAPIPCALF